jgi:predicted RNA-binding protein associated with RNAse of E/G family
MADYITREQAERALDMCAEIVVSTFGHDYDGMTYLEATKDINKIAAEMFLTMCKAKKMNKVKKD